MSQPLPGKGKLLILTGLPASGKTTVARRLSGIADGVVIISSDDIRKKAKRRVWDLMERKVAQGLGEGSIVIADATNYDRPHRDRFADVARGLGCPHWVAYLKADLGVLLERNEGREDSIPPGAIYHHSRSFREPDPEEMAIVIDTETTSPEEAARIITGSMGLQENAN
jgi:predicted kinase